MTSFLSGYSKKYHCALFSDFPKFRETSEKRTMTFLSIGEFSIKTIALWMTYCLKFLFLPSITKSNECEWRSNDRNVTIEVLFLRCVSFISPFFFHKANENNVSGRYHPLLCL